MVSTESCGLSRVGSNPTSTDLNLKERKKMIKKLEDIGFYTLSDERAQNASAVSNLMRCEILITDRCNFKCPYCRGVASFVKGEMEFSQINKILSLLQEEGMQNIRFTGGEPTIYEKGSLQNLIQNCSVHFAKHIAISTNGTADLEYYEMLMSHGVNDFSISLDGGCCSLGDKMSGGANGAWNKVVDNIRSLAEETYVTVGMVFTEDNVNDAMESVVFADSLGVRDIRIIPSAQYNRALKNLETLSEEILRKYPILRYRIDNVRKGVHVRGLSSMDTDKCPLVLDDIAIAGEYHFPCVIYLREQGNPIGKIENSSREIRRDREKWYNEHNTKEDKICRDNCLDVCRDYNNKWEYFHN
jgi:sulfatase maturation enzyme AslB (radical SAM superfamily)